MFRKLTLLASLAGIGCASLPATGQAGLSPQESGVVTAPIYATDDASQYTPKIIQKISGNPDYCINKMADFPSDNHEARYQFFRLTQDMGEGVTPEYRRALGAYGQGEVADDTPMLDVIENIANPVLRQAAPEITIANMSYVIDFASVCGPFIGGQVDSLKAFDPALNDVAFNAVITEDALFLRQVLSDSMFRLGADQDPVHSASVMGYADGLISTRDEIEFVTFESELDSLEALYMDDLDGRLKRSNDIINEEVNREILGDSVALSDSLNKAEEKKAQQRQLETLRQILGGSN